MWKLFMSIYFRGSMVPTKIFNMNIFQPEHLLPLYCWYYGWVLAYTIINYVASSYHSLLLYSCRSLVDLLGHVRGHMIIETSSDTSFEGWIRLEDYDNLVSERYSVAVTTSESFPICEHSYATFRPTQVAQL